MADDSGSSKLQFYGGYAAAFLPTVIYIVTACILAIVFKFYSMKSVTIGAFLGILIGFIFAKDKRSYWDVVIDGLAAKGNARLIILFMTIGVFTTLLSTGQIGQGFVWLSQKLHLTGSAFTVFAFLASTLFSMGAGAPIAALYAIIPILFPPGVLLGSNPALLLGALLSGVFFGDNLSPSSQVTVVTASTQIDSKTGIAADAIEVIKDRMKFILPTGLLTAILFYITGSNGQVNDQTLISSFSNAGGLLMLIPLSILLFICVKKKNILLGLSIGILSGLVVGLLSGLMTFQDIIAYHSETNQISGILYEGIYGMTDIVISSILLFGMISIMVNSGAVKAVSQALMKVKFVSTTLGSEIVIGVGMSLINLLLSGSILPSMLLYSSLANQIGMFAHIHPSRRSNLLICSGSSLSAIFPLSSTFIMGAITILNSLSTQYSFITTISPFTIFTNCYYNIILFGVFILWTFFGVGRRMEEN